MYIKASSHVYRQARLQYLQRLEDSARAANASMNINGQGFAGHPQQNTNNVQRPVGNMGFPTNNMRPHPGGMGLSSSDIGPLAGGMGPVPGNMAPRPSNMGPRPGNMEPRPRNMGPFQGNMGPPSGNMDPSSGNMGRPLMGNTGLFSSSLNFATSSSRPRSESSEISPRTKIPPRATNMGPPTTSQPANLPIPTPYDRTRYLTTSLLTQNLSEERIITLYQAEIERLRVIQLERIYDSVMQQVRSQWMQQQGGQVYDLRYGQQQMGMQQGGLQQSRQMGVQQPGSRVGFGVQQPGRRVGPGGQQFAGQYVAVQQSAIQQPAAMRSGAAPVVVDPVLLPQQTPSAEEKPLSHNKAD
jgi:hypothetical protein